jgi:hypothetical protein
MSTSDLGLLLLIGVFAFILLLYYRTRRAGAALTEFLRTNGFAPQTQIVGGAFTYSDMRNIQCFAGKLRPDVDVQLLFGRRPGGTIIINRVPVATVEEYLGILVPRPAPVPTDEWIAHWRADPDSRGERPMRVLRSQEGGILFNWRCALTRATVEARLDAVRAAWPQLENQAAARPARLGR